MHRKQPDLRLLRARAGLDLALDATLRAAEKAWIEAGFPDESIALEQIIRT